MTAFVQTIVERLGRQEPVQFEQEAARILQDEPAKDTDPPRPAAPPAAEPMPDPTPIG